MSKSCAIPVLLFLLLIFSVSEASAADGYTELSYFGGAITGYSETWLDYWEDEDPSCFYFSGGYCHLWQLVVPWVSVEGTLYTPASAIHFSDSDTGDLENDAVVDYDVSSPGAGTWTVDAEHYKHWGVYYKTCYSAAEWDCGGYELDYTDYDPLDPSDDEVDVQVLTTIDYFPNDITIPVGGSECVAVVADEGLETFDFEWDFNDGQQHNTEYGWENGAQACVADGEGELMGEYEIETAFAPGGPPVYPSPRPTLQVRPSISGNNTVYFTGENTIYYMGGPVPAGWNIVVTLTSSGGNLTDWYKDQNGSMITLSDTNGRHINVSSSGSSFSGDVADIHIRARTQGADSELFKITSRTPHELDPFSKITACNVSCSLGTCKYATTYVYKILDQLGALLPANSTRQIGTNEDFDTEVDDWVPNNWPAPPPVGATQPSSALADTLAVNTASGFSPPTDCTAGTGVYGTSVVWRPQTIRVGTTTIGVGKTVQWNKNRHYTHSGVHTDIVTPYP